MADNDFDKGVAVKVSLPGSLVDGVQAVCDSSGISKSDATKIALEKFLQDNPLWINRRYFFENLKSMEILGENPIDKLKTFRPGTFVKLVGGLTHLPSSAHFLIGVVHKIHKERLYVELPMYFSRPSSLLMDQIPVQNQIALAADAKMVVPRIENVMNMTAWGGVSSVFMYEIHSSCIWGFESEFQIELNNV